MSNATADLLRDFDSTDNYDKMVHVRETPHGWFRAVVERDMYPEAPDFYAGCPVFRVNRSGYGGSSLDDRPDYGYDSWMHDGLPEDIQEVWSRLDAAPQGRGVDTIDLVDRYLRIFHGGGARLVSSTIHRGGDDYLVYDTRAMRAYWGQEGAMLDTSDPNGDEWQAFIDGDVYIVSVERAVAFDEDGEPLDWETVGEGHIGGHYGDDWAAQAALEELDHEIESAARDMLPLGG